jgi:hypothetical protein
MSDPAKKVENLGEIVFRQLLTEAGGNFTDTVAKKLHRRLPSFNERQLVDVIKSDEHAVNVILKDYYDELSAACGEPDGPVPIMSSFIGCSRSFRSQTGPK